MCVCCLLQDDPNTLQNPVCVMFFYSDGIYSSFSLDRRTIACPLLQLMGVTRSVFVGGYEHVCPNTKARLRGSAPSSPFWLASSSTILNVMWSNKNEKNDLSWIWYQCRYLLFIWSVRHYLDSIWSVRHYLLFIRSVRLFIWTRESMPPEVSSASNVYLSLSLHKD